MPRSVSWMGRIFEIRRTVENSVKTHYSRRDIEILFRLQPRAANLLIDLMPTERVTNALLVPREALGTFLDEFMREEASTAILARRREAEPGTSRKRPRKLNVRDVELVDMDALPRSITLEPGRLEIRFGRGEELVHGLLQIALMLDQDQERFLARYEIRPDCAPDPAVGEVQRMFAELEQMERARAS